MKSTRRMFYAGQIPARNWESYRGRRDRLWRLDTGVYAPPRAPAIAAPPDMMDGFPYFCEGDGCDNYITRGRLCSECASDAR